MKSWAAALLILFLLAAGYAVYANVLAEPAVEIASQPATARVRQGDLVISLSGSGELIAQEIFLSFPMTGQVSTIFAVPGDAVAAGDTLAQLDSRQAELDLQAAQLAWNALTTSQSLADAQQQVLVLRQELDQAQKELAFIQDGPPVWYYETLLAQAKAEYGEIKKQFLGAVARKDRRAIKLLERELDKALHVIDAAEQDLEWVLAYQPDARDLALAEARLALAETRLAAQEQLVSVLSGGSLPAADASFARNDTLLALEKASLDLQKAQLTLDQSRLVAPQAGVISQVFAAPGERANGQPVMALTSPGNRQVLFYLEQSDLALLAVGARAEVHLDAYPEQVFPAVVTHIDPALVPVDGSLMVQVWAEFDGTPPVTLYPGMSLEVEVVAAQVHDALLVPLQALRSSPDGAYFVDVLQPDNTFITVPVTVGLKDLANAQVTSGLQAGDQISIASE